jgi:hypothetical protein
MLAGPLALCLLVVFGLPGGLPEPSLQLALQMSEFHIGRLSEVGPPPHGIGRMPSPVAGHGGVLGPRRLPPLRRGQP